MADSIYTHLGDHWILGKRINFACSYPGYIDVVCEDELDADCDSEGYFNVSGVYGTWRSTDSILDILDEVAWQIREEA